METEKTQTAKTILRKENRHGGIKLLTLAHTIKTQSSKQCGTNTKTDTQINKTEDSPEINPCILGQLIYNEEGKNIKLRKDSLFKKWC